MPVVMSVGALPLQLYFMLKTSFTPFMHCPLVTGAHAPCPEQAELVFQVLVPR